MNNRLLRSALVLLPVLLLLLSNCNKMSQQAELESSSALPNKAILLRSGSGYEFQNTELNQECLVGEKDLQAYLNYKRLFDETAFPDGEITPILNGLGEVLMYAINYPEGWELIAADKRCSAVLASDKSGQFVFEEQIPPVQAWLTCVGEDVLNVRAITSYDEIKDHEVVEKMQNNEIFWKMITADQEYLNERMKTRLGPDPEEFDGEWIMTSFVRDTLSYQHIDHLVQTHWHQGFPYNLYCPFLTHSYTDHAPAGCVAIATGQVAVYFHNEIGYPSTSPLTAFCDAHVPHYYPYYYSAHVNDSHMYVADLNASAWDSIPTSGNMCAKLVAEIGIAVNMQYGNTESGTSGESLSVTNIGESYFLSNGFLYSRSGFNATALVDNITNEIPVIAAAENTYGGRHAFIIDAYEYVYQKITVYYVWVPRIPEPGDQPTKVEEYYDTDQRVSMNWGEGASYDNGWYSITSNWSVNGYTFGTSNRQMLYDFSIQ